MCFVPHTFVSFVPYHKLQKHQTLTWIFTKSSLMIIAFLSMHHVSTPFNSNLAATMFLYFACLTIETLEDTSFSICADKSGVNFHGIQKKRTQCTSLIFLWFLVNTRLILYPWNALDYRVCKDNSHWHNIIFVCDTGHGSFFIHALCSSI